MKANVSKRYQEIRPIGLFLAVIACVLGCQPSGQSVDRITYADMECSTVTLEWWNDPDELDHLSNNETDRDLRSIRFQVDSLGNLYVADPRNARVAKFDPEGGFLKSFELPTSEDREYVLDVAVRGDWLAAATTDSVYVFDQIEGSLNRLEWPVDVGQYSLCSEDIAGKQVQVDEEGNIYACGMGGFERGGTIVQFDSKVHSHQFYKGSFMHFVVGWDGFVYIQLLGGTETIDAPPDYRILKYDVRGNHHGEIVIRGRDLANAGLIYPGLLIEVDSKGNLYGNAVNMLKDGEIVPQEALVQISGEGTILRIVERDEFTRPAADVLDKDGNWYLWRPSVPSGPTEIWLCSPK